MNQISNFIEYCTLKGLSKSTIKYYKTIFNYLENYFKVDISLLSQSQIRQYQVHLHSRGLKNATIANYLIGLKVFYNFIGRSDIANIIIVPKLEKKVIKVLTVDEIEILYSNLKNQRDKIIFLLMLDCGLRRSEVINLKVSDVDLQTSLILVNGKGSKQRYQKLGVILHDLLQDYLKTDTRQAPDRPLLRTKVTETLTPSAIAKIFSNLRKHTGIKVHPHMLRHNFATLNLVQQIENGNTDVFQLQLLLGHESPETTKKYLHVAQSQIALSRTFSICDSVLT